MLLKDVLLIAVSSLALTVSLITAWLTLFRRGTVKMTQPTVIFLGPDSSRTKGAPRFPKVFLRTLLFSTSKRGRVVECMHVRLSRNETYQNFNIWVYGDEKLIRGSGVFIGETGLAANHHFLTPDDGNAFRFIEGRYQLDVFARLLGDKKAKLLFSQSLEITPELAARMTNPEMGLYFDWGPDSSRYLPHLRLLPQPSDVEELLPLLEGLPSWKEMTTGRSESDKYETEVKPKQESSSR